MLVDQTHESVVVGERAVVKWAVHAEPTPASVLVPHLSEAGFTAMPEPWGFVTWQDLRPARRAGVLVASVMEYLPEASDGWTWAVQDVGDCGDRRRRPEGRRWSRWMQLGVLVADLHVALATPTSVIPDPTTAADAAELSRWRSLAEALLLERRSRSSTGRRVSGSWPCATVSRPRWRPSTPQRGTVTMPVHGDLHVGQVLRWRGGYAVGDFDGNPVLPVRRAAATAAGSPRRRGHAPVARPRRPSRGATGRGR